MVWFKRDLRVRDHAPLAEAMRFDNALGLVVIEPEWLDSPECDPRHVGFMLDCVAELQRDLAERGLPLLVRSGSMPQVLQALQREFPFTHLFSHEETGPGWSYTRDLAVAGWCRGQGVQWTETPQTGVVRRLRSRAGWARLWAQRMNAPEAPPAAGFKAAPGQQPRSVPTLGDLGVPALSAALPAGGERAAWATLESFLDGRGRDYRRAMSSPITAAEGCSRLSAHLAFGAISMRCVHQATEARIAATTDRELAYALRGFASRLRWHCHFMQKLEDEPSIEWRNVARSVDGLRAGDGVHEGKIDRERLQAWCEGRTGYPMVDACMRQLRETGWLNFRMRAMLVSFAAYHLWLHWREPGLFLARQFLDFEPGIHWRCNRAPRASTRCASIRRPSKHSTTIRRGCTSVSGCPRSAPRRTRAPSSMNARRWPLRRNSSTPCARPARPGQRPTPSSTNTARARVACHPRRPPSVAPAPHRIRKASCSDVFSSGERVRHR